MDIALWVLALLLAVAFLAAGTQKLVRPERLAEQMAWARDWSTGSLRAIGALEVLAAAGLLLPAVVDVPVLVPLAATGLALLMVGAAVTHARRREPSMIVTNVLLLAMALVVVWGRTSAYPLT